LIKQRFNGICSENYAHFLSRFFIWKTRQ